MPRRYDCDTWEKGDDGQEGGGNPTDPTGPKGRPCGSTDLRQVKDLNLNNNTKINRKIKNDISVLLNNFNVAQNYNNFTSGWGRILQNIRALENERKEEFVKKLRSSITHGLRASLNSNPGRCYEVVYE